MPGYPLIPQVKEDVCAFVPPTNMSSSNDVADSVMEITTAEEQTGVKDIRGNKR